jgi:hypothetical protein
MVAAAVPAEQIAGFTIGQPHEIPDLVAGHIEAGADEVLFSFAFADTAGITRWERHSDWVDSSATPPGRPPVPPAGRLGRGPDPHAADDLAADAAGGTDHSGV